MSRKKIAPGTTGSNDTPDMGRRSMLLKLGLAAGAVYAAPVLLQLSEARASDGGSRGSRNSRPSRGSRASRGSRGSRPGRGRPDHAHRSGRGSRGSRGSRG